MRSLDESLMEWLFHLDEPHSHRLEDEDQNLWMKKAREEILEQSWWITNLHAALLVAFFSLTASWFLATRYLLLYHSLRLGTKRLMMSSTSPCKRRYGSGDSHIGTPSDRAKLSSQLSREKRAKPEDGNGQGSCTPHHDKRSVSGVNPRFRCTPARKSIIQSGSSEQDRQLKSPVTVVRSGDKETDNVFTGGAGEPHLSLKNRGLPFRLHRKDVQEIEENRSKQTISDQRAIVSRVHLDNFAKRQYSIQTHCKLRANERKVKQCEHRDNAEPSGKKAVVKKINKRAKIVPKKPSTALGAKSNSLNKRSHDLSTRTSPIICVEEAASDLLCGNLESIRSKYLGREVNIDYPQLSPRQPAPEKVLGQARNKAERDPRTNGKRHPPALRPQVSAEGRAIKKATPGDLMKAKVKKHESQETSGELSTSQSSLPFEEWACPTQKVKTKTVPFQDKNKAESEHAFRATKNRDLEIDHKPNKTKLCINHVHQHFEDYSLVDDTTYFKNGKRKLSAAFPECPAPKFCEVGTNLYLESLEKAEERRDRASAREPGNDSQVKGPLWMSKVAAGDSMPKRPHKRVLEKIRREVLPAHVGQAKHQTVAGHKYRKRTIKLLKDALVSLLVKAMGKLQLSPAQPVATDTKNRQEQTRKASSTYADQAERYSRAHRKRIKVLYGQNSSLVKRILGKGAIEGAYRTFSQSSEATCEAYQKRQATRVISPSCDRRQAVLLLHAPRSSSKSECSNIKLVEMADVPLAQGHHSHHSCRDHKDPTTTKGLLNQLLQSAATSQKRCSRKCGPRKEQETAGAGTQTLVTQITDMATGTPEHSKYFAQCHKLINDVSDSEEVMESIATADEEDSDYVFRSPPSCPARARNKPFTSNKKTDRIDTLDHQSKWASVIKPRISRPHCVSRPYKGNIPQSTKLLKRRQCMHRYHGHRVNYSEREDHYFKKAEDTLRELRDTACFKLSQRKLREENSPTENTLEKNSTTDSLGSSTLDILSQITVRNSNSPTDKFKGDDFTEKESEVLLNGEQTAPDQSHFNDSRAQTYWNIQRKSNMVHRTPNLMRASFTSSKAVNKFTGKTASEYGHKRKGNGDHEKEVMNKIRSHQSLSDDTEKGTFVRQRTKIPRYVKNSKCNWQPSLDSLDKTHPHQSNGIDQSVRDQVFQNLQTQKEGNNARYEIQGHTRVRNTSSAERSSELNAYKRPMPSEMWNSHQRQRPRSQMKHPWAVSKEAAANFGKYDRAKLGSESDRNIKGNMTTVGYETEGRNDFIGGKLKKKTIQGIQAVKNEVRPRPCHTMSIILHPRAGSGYVGPNRDLLASWGDKIHVDEATDRQGTYQGPRSSSERLKHMCSPEACRLCGTHTHHNRTCDLGRNDTKTSHQQYTLNSQVHKSGGHSAHRLREPTTTQEDSTETSFIWTRQAPFSQKIQGNRPTSTGHHTDKNVTKTHKNIKESVSPLTRDAKKTVTNSYESNQRAREFEVKLCTSGHLERSTVSHDKKGSQSPIQARVMPKKRITGTSKSLATSRPLRPSRIPVLQRLRREASLCRGKQQSTQQSTDISYSKPQNSVLYSFVCNCLRSMPSGKSKNMPLTEDLGFAHRVPSPGSTSNISFSKEHHSHFRPSPFDYISPSKQLNLGAITSPRREDSTLPKLFDTKQFKAGYHKYIASPSTEGSSCGRSKHCSMQRPNKSQSSLLRNTRAQVCQGRQYARPGKSPMSQLGRSSSRNTDSPGPQRECQTERFQRENHMSERKSLAWYNSSLSRSVSRQRIERSRSRNSSDSPTSGMQSGRESPSDLKHDTKQFLDHLSRSPQTPKNNVWRESQHDSTAENKVQSPIETITKSDTGKEKKFSATNKAIAGRSPHQVKQTKTSLQRLIARQKQLEYLASTKEDDQKNVVKQKVMAENKLDGARIKHHQTPDCHGTTEPADRRRAIMKESKTTFLSKRESKTTSLSKRKQADNVFQAPVRSQVVVPKSSGKKGTAFTSDVIDTVQISPIVCPSLKQTASPVMYFTEVELPGSSTCRRTKLVKTLGSEDIGENITPQECTVVATTEGQGIDTGASRSLWISKENLGGQAPSQLQDVKHPHEECETLKLQWHQLHGAQIDRGILNLRNTDVLQQRPGANEAGWAQVRSSDTNGSGGVMREQGASILSQARNDQNIDHNCTLVTQSVNERSKMKGPSSVKQNGLGMVGLLQNQSDDKANLLTNDLNRSPKCEDSSRQTVDVECRHITTLIQTLDCSGGSQGRSPSALSSKSVSALGKASVSKGQRLGEHQPSGPLVPLRHLTDIHNFQSFRGSRRNRSILNKIKVLRSRDRLHKLAAAFSRGESDSLNKIGTGTAGTLESNTTTPSLLSERRPMLSPSHQVSGGLVVGEEDKQEAAHHLSGNVMSGSGFRGQSTDFDMPVSSQDLSAPQPPKAAENRDPGAFTSIRLTAQPKVKENQAGDQDEVPKEREKGMVNLLAAHVKQVESRENPTATLPDSVLSSADVSLSWRINPSEPDIFNCSALQTGDQDTGMISRVMSSGQNVSEENKLQTFPDVNDINNHMVSHAASSLHMTYAKNCSSSVFNVKRQNVSMNSDVSASDMLKLDQNKNRRAGRRNGNGPGRLNRIQESPHNYLQRNQVTSDKTNTGTRFDSGSTLSKHSTSYGQGYYHSHSQINARPKSAVGTQIGDGNQRDTAATTAGKAMDAKREREVAHQMLSFHHSSQQNIYCRVKGNGLSEYELRASAHDRCGRSSEISYAGQSISQNSNSHRQRGYYGHEEYSSGHQAVNAAFALREDPHRSSTRDKKQSLQIPMSMHTASSSGRNVTKNNNDDARTHSTISMYNCNLQHNRIRNTATPSLLPDTNIFCCDDTFTQRRTNEDSLTVAESNNSFQTVSNPSLRRSTVATAERNDTLDGEGNARFGVFGNVHQPDLDWYKPSTSSAPETGRTDNVDVDSNIIAASTSRQTRQCPRYSVNRPSSSGIVCESPESSLGYFLHTTDHQPNRDRASIRHSEGSIPSFREHHVIGPSLAPSSSFQLSLHKEISGTNPCNLYLSTTPMLAEENESNQPSAPDMLVTSWNEQTNGSLKSLSDIRECQNNHRLHAGYSVKCSNTASIQGATSLVQTVSDQVKTASHNSTRPCVISTPVLLGTSSCSSSPSNLTVLTCRDDGQFQMASPGQDTQDWTERTRWDSSGPASCSVHRQPVSGFSYLYNETAIAGVVTGSHCPASTARQVNIKVRGPKENTFVGHLVKMFENKLRFRSLPRHQPQ